MRSHDMTHIAYIHIYLSRYHNIFQHLLSMVLVLVVMCYLTSIAVETFCSKLTLISHMFKFDLFNGCLLVAESQSLSHNFLTTLVLLYHKPCREILLYQIMFPVH